MLIDRMTRTELETECLVETGMDVSDIEAATDEELRAALRAWVEAGDEACTVRVERVRL